MTKIVLDTSVIFKWLNVQNENLIDEAEKILDQLRKGRIKVYLPELSKYEVGNALWKRKLSSAEVNFDLEIFYDYPLEFISLDLPLSKRTSEIALDNNITFYDASFIAVAEKLGANLVTENSKHQRSGIKTKIKILPLDFID